jgi:regulator of extracellular matrix RemA (YlzA/DUF370 family)
VPAKAKPAKTDVPEIELDGERPAPRDQAAPLWSAGMGGLIARERVVAVGRWDSAPIRRAARQARQTGRLIDLTFGYACKSVVFMDTGQVVLSASLHFWPEPVPFEPTPDDDRLSQTGGAA